MNGQKFASKLDFNERWNLAAQLRRFVNHNEALLEDTFGYSPGHYVKIINDFGTHGYPKDADDQKRLRELMSAAF